LVQDDEGTAPEQAHGALFTAIAAFSIALHKRMETFDATFSMALESDEYMLALRELDGLCNAVGDRVFALMQDTFLALLGKVEPSDILPGHHRTLERALLVRRELAKLRRQINACNKYVQGADTPAAQRLKAYNKLVQLLGTFVRSRVYPAMRAQDRLDLRKVYKALEGRSVDEAGPQCSACATYLNSLIAINQRSVLVRHDKELLQEIEELVETAITLSASSTRSGAQLANDAWEKADALVGRTDALDRALAVWNAKPPSLTSTKHVEAAAKKLAELCAK